jgi:hypothetical protein
MENVKSKTCQHDGCKKQPAYNHPGLKKGIFCSEHKLDGMENVISKTCKTQHCGTRISNFKYAGYCHRCAIFNNIQVARNYKTKENAVFDYLKSSFPDFTWIQDKRVEDGCSGYRPDIRVDFGSHVLIIEVDENKHENYDCSCESKRLFEISQDLGCRPILLIRFNPDQYENEETGEIVKSCWSAGKDGICKVSDRKKKEWSRRLQKLQEKIAFSIENIPTNKIVFSHDVEIVMSMDELFFF